MLKNTPLKTVAFEGKDHTIGRNPLDFDSGPGNIALVQDPAADSYNAGGRHDVVEMSGNGQIRKPLSD